MNEYSICTDVYEIAAGTRNKLSPVFREAAENIDNATPKGFGYIKNFIISIEELSKKDAVKDSRISSSNGNIKNFKGYGDIESALSFLNKYLKDVPTVKECSTVFDALEKFQPLYTEAYDKKVRLLVLEYENAVYLLVTTLSMLLANNMDVVSNGSEIRIQKKSATTFGVIPKTLSKLAKELGDRSHKEYLETMIKRSADADNADDIEESTYTEGVVSDTLTLISAILTNVGKLGANVKHIIQGVKKSLFGIIPLIRAIIFLRYKKKADTIIALEDQIIFIKQNIEQLQNRKNIDPEKKAEIIKKQMAVVEAYKKKAEKLRAELCEQEKEASVEIKKDDTNIKDMDDDYVLEYVMLEKAYKSNRKLHKTRKRANRTQSEVSEIRKDALADNKRFRSVKKDNLNIKDLDAKIEKAAQKLFDDTAIDAIRLKPGKNYKTDDLKKLTETKIGGIPYWPKDMKWPTYKNAKGEDKPMICITQLNLDKLPKLKGYPSTGLLQFFYYDTYNNGTCERKVVYHKKYDSKDVLTDVPDSTIGKDDYDSPIIGLYYPTAKIIKSGIEFENEIDEDGNKASFNDYEVEYINKALGTDYKRQDIPHGIYRKFWDSYWNVLKKTDNGPGCKIGGWPSLVQFDYRDKKHAYILLQLDSEDGMMWGDSGNAHYMISKNDLKNKKFDDVFFDWSCC